MWCFRLPHIYPPGMAIAGSVPPSLAPLPRSTTSGEAFVWLDRQLDTARYGPVYLRQPEIARIVVASIHQGVALGHYALGAYVVMSNHVHLLIQPCIPPGVLLNHRKAPPRGRPTGSWDEPFALYIEANPVKAGLILREDFPWSSAHIDSDVAAPCLSPCAASAKLDLI